MKLKFLFISILIFLQSCCEDCCNSDKPCENCPSYCIKVKKPTRKYNNVQIILDLSDRMDDINQKSRDIQILNKLYNAFTDQIVIEGYENTGLWKSKDIFKIILASQNSTDSLKLKYEMLLTTDYRSIPDSLKAKDKKKRIINFESSVNKLYSTKIKHLGSNVSVDLKNSETALQDTMEYKNVIILITDGEQDNFESEITGINLSTVSIFIIEINNPSNNLSDLTSKENNIKEYFKNSNPIFVKPLNNKISPSEIVQNIFKSSTTDPKPEEIINKKEEEKEKKNHSINLNEVWIQDKIKFLSEKIKKSENICASTAYVSIRSQIEAHKGIGVSDEKKRDFDNQINNVLSICK